MNEPKYQIGDRLPGTEIYIRGIATLSNGNRRYFMQVEDNTMVFDGKSIDALGKLLQYAYGNK